jgi:hypothetical protein
MKTQRKLTTRIPTKKQLEAIKPHEFKPGQSGNAGGRPRKGKFTDELELKAHELVPNDPEKRTWARVLAEQLFFAAARGNLRAFAEIADRIEGKTIQRVDIERNSPEDDPKEKLLTFIDKLRATNDCQK